MQRLPCENSDPNGDENKIKLFQTHYPNWNNLCDFVAAVFFFKCEKGKKLIAFKKAENEIL